MANSKSKSKSGKEGSSLPATRDQNADETLSSRPAKKASILPASLANIEFAYPRKNRKGLMIASLLLCLWIVAIGALAVFVNFA